MRSFMAGCAFVYGTGDHHVKDFILLMHTDSTRAETAGAWERYFTLLRTQGIFDGGSAIGGGDCYRQDGAVPDASSPLVGFIRIRADDLAHARRALAGNPVFESGGTVEIRELTED
jgi:hypothetical protein